MKAILVTTSLRGVFAGLVADDQDLTERTLRLVDAKMAIYWGTTGGVAELAEVGPNSKSKIGSKATCTIHDISAVWEMTPEAARAWNYDVA